MGTVTIETETSIWVKFQKEGIHRYPDALNNPELADVKFLGYPHRHIFHFHVEIEVFHGDREIEFILFKRELEALYGEKTLEIDYKSCEMLATDVVNYLLAKYPERSVTVTVSEDGENGATVKHRRITDV